MKLGLRPLGDHSALDDLQRDRLIVGLLAVRLARGSALESRVDLDFGTVSPDDFEGRVPLTTEWLSFLRDEVDVAVGRRRIASHQVRRGSFTLST